MSDQAKLTTADVEVQSRDTVFKGHFRMDRWRLRHKLFAGGWNKPIVREGFERGAAVAVLPDEPGQDKGGLIEQVRIGARAHGEAEPWLLEVVAGVIEAGETPEDVARRETLEECGGTLGVLEP